jgi:hypothetical protein
MLKSVWNWANSIRFPLELTKLSNSLAARYASSFYFRPAQVGFLKRIPRANQLARRHLTNPWCEELDCRPGYAQQPLILQQQKKRSYRCSNQIIPEGQYCSVGTLKRKAISRNETRQLIKKKGVVIILLELTHNTLRTLHIFFAAKSRRLDHIATTIPN